MQNIAAVCLRIIIIIESLISVFIWTRKFKQNSRVNIKTIAVLMVISSIGFIAFAVMTILNHSLYEIESSLLNIVSNTARIVAITTILVSGLLFNLRETLIEKNEETIQSIIKKLGS